MPRMKPPRKPSVTFGDTFSLGALARRWRVPRREVRRLLQEGKVPFVEIEGRLRVPKREVAGVPKPSATVSRPRSVSRPSRVPSRS